jgi:chromosome segregation ATPase
MTNFIEGNPESQIMEVQRVMGSYSLQINNHRENVRRLEEALNKLNMTKSDFYESEDKCSKPEFTARVLYGSHERDLTSFRENTLKPGFSAIPDVQITGAVNQIQEQIELLQTEIGRLESSISSLRSQESNLIVRKREVQNQT